MTAKRNLEWGSIVKSRRRDLSREFRGDWPREILKLELGKCDFLRFRHSSSSVNWSMNAVKNCICSEKCGVHGPPKLRGPCNNSCFPYDVKHFYIPAQISINLS